MNQKSHYVENGNLRGKVIQRRRQNQPEGYDSRQHGGREPTRHNCRKHNYVYYPQGWTDKESGKEYKRGYYDEDGQYYRSVVFKKDGRYQNVMCVCDYCGSRMTRDLVGETTLLCSQCGGPLRIESELDEYTQDPRYTEVMGVTEEPGKKKRKIIRRLAIPGVLLLIVFLIVVFSGGGSDRTLERSSTGETREEDSPDAHNLELFGATLYLDKTEEGYVLSEDGAASYDKKLSWDYGENGYYDPEAKCWLLYNTSVLPNLWQYWYEGISSDYWDEAWMEYEPTGWYIEESYDHWIPLPEKYVSDRLWHMAIDPADYD